MTNGLILKGVGGFYYVKTQDGKVYMCTARGRFRYEHGKPLAGDIVEIEPNDIDDTGVITHILPRKNALLRPPVSNIDALVLIVSEAPPKTDLYLIDKMTAISFRQRIPVTICVNKCDIADGERLAGIYARAGFPVIRTSAATGAGTSALSEALSGKISVLAGNSGVGKSSLINLLDINLTQEVGSISEKISRGRHTTRKVELFPMSQSGYIADTPGFSLFDADKMDTLLKEDLQHAFPEFAPFIEHCYYTGCSHTVEKGCAVLDAVSSGEIEKTRHESYCAMYEISPQHSYETQKKKGSR